MTGLFNAGLLTPVAVVVALAFLFGSTAPAQAQRDAAAGSVLKDLQRGGAGGEELRLPEGVPAPPPSPGLELPPMPPPPARGGVPSALRAFVRRIDFEGNTVISSEELAVVTQPYVGREVTFEDLEAARYAVSRLYVERGYINSGAVIPDQDLVDGVVVLRIIEGRLSEIRIEGNRWLRASYISGRIERYAGPPLDVDSLQTALQLLQQDPAIHRLDAELRPGTRLGEARLDVRVEEVVPFRLGLAFDNYRPPGIGGQEGVFDLADKSLTGNGDPLGVRISYGGGITEVDSDYTLPLNARGTAASLRYEHAVTSAVEQPFKDLDIASKANDYGIALTQSLRPDLETTVNLLLSGEYRRSETFLLGRPFSFSLGPIDGVSRESIVRLGAEWANQGPAQVVAARARLTVGFGIFGATENPRDIADGRFVSGLAQVQWVRRLDPWGIDLIARADLQLTPDALLPFEQFAVGGRYTVRGYAENQIVEDEGAAASVEARFPLLHRSNGAPLLQIAPFFDTGGGWAATGPSPDPSYLASIGVGLLVPIGRDLRFEVYWGQRLVGAPSSGNALQDNGISLQLATFFSAPESVASWIEPGRWWRDAPSSP